jgi:acyl carrier protein
MVIDGGKTDMTVEEAIKFINVFISEALEQDTVDAKITKDMPLIGGTNAIDSMKLVELCLALEDKASEIGFEFDWTSETALSQSRSMFRSIQALAEEFSNQYREQQ